jgi:hypothetical protein
MVGLGGFLIGNGLLNQGFEPVNAVIIVVGISLLAIFSREM